MERALRLLHAQQQIKTGAIEMGGLHWYDLAVLLGLAILFFGPKRMPELGSAVGKTIKEFRKSISEVTEPQTPPAVPPPAPSAQTPALPASSAPASSAPASPAVSETESQ
jgi:sec-independent protein translocase protein TatA